VQQQSGKKSIEITFVREDDFWLWQRIHGAKVIERRGGWREKS
jgi:hypothetical protein